MNRPPPPTETPVLLAQVWPGLPSDLQQRVVRLLAQLAYVRLRPQASLSPKEIRHADPTHQSQDSSRPS
jgi:hypothetical protein